MFCLGVKSEKCEIYPWSPERDAQRSLVITYSETVGVISVFDTSSLANEI